MLRRTILVIAVVYLAVAPIGVLAQGTGGDPFQNQSTNVPLVPPGAPGTPEAVAAQQSAFKLFPIVTCGTQAEGPSGACTPCDLLDTLENMVKFVTIGVTGPVAALMFIYSGFLFLFYGANPGMVSRAKTVLTNTVYGVAIILMSWIITVQLIKTVARQGSGADRWYEFNCPAFLGGIGGAVDLGAPEDGLTNAFADIQDITSCGPENYQTFATQFNSNANPEAEAPELRQLIDCLLEDPVIAAAHDPTQLFTYERSQPICNILRGFNNCGVCQHSLYSCHYGGGNGDQGAQAVDFNFKGQATGEAVKVMVDGKEVIVRNERDLARQLLKAANGERTGTTCNFKLLNFEGSHTHISTLACDADGQSTSIRGF